MRDDVNISLDIFLIRPWPTPLRSSLARFVVSSVNSGGHDLSAIGILGMLLYLAVLSHACLSAWIRNG